MLKRYIYKGLEWQFEDGRKPAGAIEVKQKEDKSKKAPANKARREVKDK